MNLCQNMVFIAVRFLWDTDRQVATVVMETVQVVLSQFKNFLWEQDMVKSSGEFENGFVPKHCGARMMIWKLLCSSIDAYDNSNDDGDGDGDDGRLKARTRWCLCPRKTGLWLA